MHGGVYVPATNKTLPNPYLSDMPERDIKTPSGRQLTLMNPAYMTRQVYELEREVSGARSHLTSLKPIKPDNAPDEWEKKALLAFEKGVTEISSIEHIAGREYFRLMRPVMTEQGCLKCHAGQGYKVNDIRGGISVSLPMDSIRELASISQSRSISIYLLLWLIGTGGIVFGYYRVSKSEAKRNQAEKKLEITYLDLEMKVQVRTAQLTQVNEMLQKEQQFLAAVFDSIEEGIVFCDANGVLARFNHATRQIYGLPEEPIPADQWALHYDLFLPDGKTPMQKEDVPLFRALQGEHVRNAEMMIIPKHGHARTLVASGQTLKDPAGKIIGTIATMHDITERKQAEEEIKAINEELIAINRIITAITGVSNIKEILEKMLDEALGITGLEGGTICMVTPQNTLQLAAHRATSEATIHDLTTNEIKVGDCLCGECARDQKPLILWDREAVLKFATREATRGEDIRFHAAFPLITGGRCLGVLCVFTRTEKKPEERKLKLLETVTAQIALAVQNAGLFEEILRNTAILDDRVKERTAELQQKLAEIERLNRLFVGRELRMKELKEKIRELEAKLNGLDGRT